MPLQLKCCDALQTDDHKEPYGPGSRDYFWLLSQLIDNLDVEDAARSNLSDSTLGFNVNTLTARVADALLARPFIERRHDSLEDDGLIGLLSLEMSLVKHDPPFRTSEDGQLFIRQVFDFLFALPSASDRLPPKCKSQGSRSVAFDLLVELVRGSVDNYSVLHSLLVAQHSKNSHAPYRWDMWPHDDQRSESGFVGLTNLGATCYMATCMQHMFMMPDVRRAVLEADINAAEPRLRNTLLELKQMFAYLLVCA